MDLKTIKRAIEQVSEEKGIDAAKVLEAIESSIAAAYKKEYEKKGEVIQAKFDLKTGELKFWQVKTVVDETTVRFREEKSEDEEGEEPEAALEEESEEGEEVLPRYNSDRHITLEEAKKIKKGAELSEEMLFPLETHEEFGRIAAQSAKQVILQRLREAERDSIIKEFKGREGEIVSGTVQRMERGTVFIDVGRATAIMPYNEQIPAEHYRIGERLKFFIVEVKEDARIPSIILSRAHPDFVRHLFELEIPEITDNTIELKAIAREPGSRTKVAVASNVEGVDPVGSCVGQRGTRVMAVSNELGQEKIDIIEWSEDPAHFIASSLSPARVNEVEILPNQEARVFVPNDQLSLAIGRGGQNVRLAAKLTGWKIDVRSITAPEEVHEEGVADFGEGEDATTESEVKAETETETETPVKEEEATEEKEEKAKED
ncbi:MAG: transcription termination/antitermination protein NusA [Candidatus Harrisonbacteria bacterium CG10_big_fil_rev_8_21_14_0_10_49_15]|uniref:Transcription termination/antitermination protein NusA n=1 Tax=Candidatus Harrisonbacteria bacterium CG10_big_fil_rev_8_21_14_0_10_49_15 TaxID=1974587 RepID=A0A2H0UK38_9BACT|nr:MAG: transcription termination/antitermination protein NusA [Candidatus Harrisonbacteria bacterium CG10_big_fil_rev_8_21_14_0_10_49_15]